MLTVKEKFTIQGMSCDHCVRAVIQELNSLPVEVKKVEIGSAEVAYDPQRVTSDMIRSAIADAGYEAAANGPQS